MGNSANAFADYSNAIGYQAEVSNSSNSAIQLGYGTNSTAKSFSVGFYDNSTPTNYQLLDGITGLIPDARLSSNIARTSAIPNISNLANKSLSNLDSTGQGVIDGKADVDLTNVNNSGTSRGASWAMPSDTYESLTVGASGTQYTAPSNGWVLVSGRGSGQLVVYTTVSYMTSGVGYNTSSPPATTFIPVKKGDYFKVEYYNMNSIGIRFIYAVGSESEAN
jgi:hypothetical protein